jgi:hypothetical protein
VEVLPRTKAIYATKRALATIFFTGTKFLVLNLLLRERKFYRGHLLVIMAPESSKENARAKRRADKNKLVTHMNDSICHNGPKIREYFALKTITRVLHPVWSPDLSPYDFWLFGYAKG